MKPKEEKSVCLPLLVSVSYHSCRLLSTPLLLPFSNRESKEFSRCVSVDIKNRRLILPQPTADAATWDEYCTFDASPLHSIETYVNIAHKRGKEKKCLHLCEK